MASEIEFYKSRYFALLERDSKTPVGTIQDSEPIKPVSLGTFKLPSARKAELERLDRELARRNGNP